MALIFRAMLRDGDMPRIGPTKRTLGVKVGNETHDDIPVDDLGNVSPKTGGMSVAPTWRDLPPHRIPRRLKPLCPKAAGNDNYECWRMGEGPFKDERIWSKLNLTVTSKVHGNVEPSDVMVLDDFQQSLAATQKNWVVDSETIVRQE